MTPDEQVLNSNQEAIAAAIRSIGLANALTWAAVAALLNEKGVLPMDKFADLASTVAGFIEKSDLTDNPAGAQMLREVHDILRKQNPQKFTPTIVQ